MSGSRHCAECGQQECCHVGQRITAPGGIRQQIEDRNVLARECADLRDQRDDMAREVARLKDHIEVIDDDRRTLCEELFQATGRNWVDEEARRWSS